MGADRIKVLLTVPNFVCTESPWREAMGLARFVRKDKIDLTICGLRPDGHAETEAILAPLGVQSVVARFRPRGAGIRRALSSLQDFKILRSLGRFDVQHSMDFTPSPWEAMMHRRISRRFHFSQRNLNENGSKLALRLKCAAAGPIVCISRAAEQFLRDLGATNRLVLVPPGIECDQIPFAPGTGRHGGRRSLLMVGHVARRKGIEIGIRAAGLLLQRGYDFEVLIAGRIDEPAYKQELELEASRLGLGGKVQFLGPRRDVFNLMKEAALLLHTAGSEAFGMVLIEALAIGLPVVAPDHQGPREILEHGVSGLLAKPGDSAEFGAAMETILKSDGVAEQLRIQGRRRVEQTFSAQRMTEGLEAVYTGGGR